MYHYSTSIFTRLALFSLTEERGAQHAGIYHTCCCWLLGHSVLLNIAARVGFSAVGVACPRTNVSLAAWGAPP
jgi:hypothetical protein